MSQSDTSTGELPQRVKMSPLELTCISSATRSLTFSTDEAIEIVPEGLALVGSIVVCEVVSIGAHEKVEDQSGRYVRINPGDPIIGVTGNRDSIISMYGGYLCNVSVAECIPMKPWPALTHAINASLSGIGSSPVVFAKMTAS